MSIEKVYHAGEDALQNMFEILFVSSFVLTEEKEFLTKLPVRVHTITIPESGVETYTNHYQNISVDRITSKSTLIKEFNFTFRVDRDWVFYKSLVEWSDLVSSPQQLGVDVYTGNKHPFRLDMLVKSLDETLIKRTTNEWKFKGVYPKKVPQVDLDYSSGEPIVIDVTMGCIELKKEEREND